MPRGPTANSTYNVRGFHHNILLRSFTTMRVGGPARYFIRVATEKRLIKAVREAERVGLAWVVIGEGSNIIPPDQPLDALVIKNEIAHIRQKGKRVIVGSGTNLLKLIQVLNANSLAGFEKMAGIPGSVGGAIYGSAGAYGQEIKDCLRRVKIFDASKKPNTDPVQWISREECQFGYRESIFKKRKRWVLLEAEFQLSMEDPRTLQKTSRDIIRLRKQKYRPDLRCPGSFFKNIVLADIRPAKRRSDFLKKIPPEKIQYGKIPAGYLLECVGAKGMRVGNIVVAEHHGNLIYNRGNGTTEDIKKLAKILKTKVEKRFGIRLEEEVQYI